MGERMLNAKLTFADGLKRFGDKTEKVSITNDIIELAPGARSSYLTYLGAHRERE